MKNSTWLAPIFIVIALFAIWLTLYYLPSDIFGEYWSTFKDNMWSYLPWLVVFGVALYSLKVLVSRRKN